MLHLTPILVVEDDPMIAMAIESAISDARGLVMGPYSSVAEALENLETLEPQVAVLATQLKDGCVTPVVEALAAKGIPILLQTGRDVPAEIGERFVGLPVLEKPFTAGDLVVQLRLLIDGESSRRTG